MASSEISESAVLERFVDRLLADRADAIEFVVLFGSRARGNWTRDSDYDVLVGLRGDDGKRLIDRMREFSAFADGNVEVFPYDRAAWQQMFEDRNILLLDALEHGQVSFDRGAFDAMRRTFQRWFASGEVARSGSGWRI